MIEVSRTMAAAPHRIFSVLADGWSFAGWVVGTSHIRAVDADWPKAGSRIHHSVGPWPLSAEDVTIVEAVEPDSSLDLQAALWPFGAALVRLTLRPVDDGHTRVHLAEELRRGPARFIPSVLQSLLFLPRNAESLRRLEDIVLNRPAERTGS